MASNLSENDSIGPELDLDSTRLPPHLGERLAAFYDRRQRLATAAEWVAVMERTLRRQVDELDPGTVMCTDPDGDHEVTVDGETRSYVCVLDPLAMPFLAGEPATVRSRTPLDEGEVTVAVQADGVDVTPADAVLSLGVGHGVADEEPTLEAAYAQLCAYTHAFASAGEYERWAATVDAATTSLSVRRGVGLARALVETIDH